MKIRNGFVSNSSSSSFLVAFPRTPLSVEDVKEMVFKDQTTYDDPYSKKSWSANKVSKTIWEDIQGQDPLNPNYITGYFEDGPEIELDEEDWMEQLNYFTSSKNRTFLRDYNGSAFYNFEFEDGGGDYFAALEHGDLFWRLPHLKASNH